MHGNIAIEAVVTATDPVRHSRESGNPLCFADAANGGGCRVKPGMTEGSRELVGKTQAKGRRAHYVIPAKAGIPHR
jgi:hypothetical protein